MPNIKPIFAFIFSYVFFCLSVYLFTFVVCSKVVGFSSIRRESQCTTCGFPNSCNYTVTATPS